MKKWIGILAVSVFAVVAVAGIFHEFVANDTIGYFTMQPSRLLMVASVGIVGGLVALFFERLSPRVRRGLKLYTLASAASSLTVFTVYFLVESAASNPQLGASEFRRTFILIPACLAAIILLLWIEFYQVFKRRVE